MSPNSKGILYMYAHLIIVLSVSKGCKHIVPVLITHMHSFLVSFAIDTIDGHGLSEEVLHQHD